MDKLEKAKKWGFENVESMEAWGRCTHQELMDGIGACGASTEECQKVVDFWHSMDNVPSNNNTFCKFAGELCHKYETAAEVTECNTEAEGINSEENNVVTRCCYSDSNYRE